MLLVESRPPALSRSKSVSKKMDPASSSTEMSPEAVKVSNTKDWLALLTSVRNDIGCAEDMPEPSILNAVHYFKNVVQWPSPQFPAKTMLDLAAANGISLENGIAKQAGPDLAA